MSLTDLQPPRSGAIVATALIATVVTQILYMAFLGGPQPSDPSAGISNADIVSYFTDRWQEAAIVWTVEAAAFIAIAAGSLVGLASGRHRLGWAALALAGVFNIVQIGIGLSLFKPVAMAGEAYTWMFWAIVSGAFAFYFIAKIALGIAAFAFGLILMREASGLGSRIVGGLTVLLGVAAAIANTVALGAGMSWLIFAGASGTLAALMLAASLAITSKGEAR